jgi:hypothetical protein
MAHQPGSDAVATPTADVEETVTLRCLIGKHSEYCHPIYALASVLGTRSSGYTWGGCQYQPAEIVYYALVKLKTMGYADPVASPTRDALTPQPLVADRRSVVEVVGSFVDTLIQDEGECEGRPVDDKLKDTLEALREVSSLDPVIGVLRDLNWGLWSAAPTLANLVFGGYQAKIKKLSAKIFTRAQFMHDAPTGLITGISCFLLVDCGYVSGPGVFTGFDT